MSQLYVGNLPWRVDDEDLRVKFGRYGELESAKVMKDAETGKSKGFGFVCFKNSDDGTEAKVQLDGFEWFGRSIRVNDALNKARAHNRMNTSPARKKFHMHNGY